MPKFSRTGWHPKRDNSKIIRIGDIVYFYSSGAKPKRIRGTVRAIHPHGIVIISHNHRTKISQSYTDKKGRRRVRTISKIKQTLHSRKKDEVHILIHAPFILKKMRHLSTNNQEINIKPL